MLTENDDGSYDDDEAFPSSSKKTSKKNQKRSPKSSSEKFKVLMNIFDFIHHMIINSLNFLSPLFFLPKKNQSFASTVNNDLDLTEPKTKRKKVIFIILFWLFCQSLF